MDLLDTRQLFLLRSDLLVKSPVNLLVRLCQQAFDLLDGKIGGLQIFDLNKINGLRLVIVPIACPTVYAGGLQQVDPVVIAQRLGAAPAKGGKILDGHLISDLLSERSIALQFGARSRG